MKLSSILKDYPVLSVSDRPMRTMGSALKMRFRLFGHTIPIG